jgi:hypothetical protein
VPPSAAKPSSSPSSPTWSVGRTPADTPPLLISSANGIAGLEASGQLTDPKWGGVSAEDLTDNLVDMIAGKSRHA